LIKLLRCSLLLVLLSAAPYAMAETKIGYVQIQNIMQSPASLEVGKKLQKEFSARSAELNRQKKVVEDKAAALDKDSLTMSEADRRAKTQDISNQRLDLQRKDRELAEDFEMRKNEEKAKLQDRVNKAVNAVAVAEGYDLVLYGNAAYAGKKADITDKVIKAIK
jgi:outer membrane protein